MKLAITFLGQDKPELQVHLIEMIAECGCAVYECHTNIMDNISAGHLLASGDWHEVAKLESSLKQFGLDQGIQVQISRVEDWTSGQLYLPYTIEVFAHDRSGILFELIQFLQSQNILITQVKTSRQCQNKMMAELFCVNLGIAIPVTAPIISLREEFLDFCENAGIDAILEPVKI